MYGRNVYYLNKLIKAKFGSMHAMCVEERAYKWRQVAMRVYDREREGGREGWRLGREGGREGRRLRREGGREGHRLGREGGGREGRRLGREGGM